MLSKTNLHEFAKGSRILNSQELAKIKALAISTTMMVAEILRGFYKNNQKK